MTHNTTPPSDTFFQSLSKKLKPLNSAEDLVDLGLAGSTKTLSNKRSSGEGPSFLRIKGTGIRYPKTAVLEWLQRDSVFVQQRG